MREFSSILLASLFLICITDKPTHPTYAESILTRSTAASGKLMCGKLPAKGAHVRLLRNNTDVKTDVLARAVCGDDGSFSIEGTTAGRPLEESGIQPTLRFYHKCDVDAKKAHYRSFSMHYNKTHVTLGRIPRKPYAMGTLNLELEFPKEKTIKDADLHKL